ncbi:hypothetical protein [Terrisporobacter sp.]
MNKRNKIIIGIVVFLLGIVGILKFSFSSGYKISIHNNTNKTTCKLEIKYKTGNVIENISQIKPKSSWKYTIDTKNLEWENAIILTYKDNKGNLHEEYMVGYIEKGYRGRVNATIYNIDKDGKLNMKINEY